MVEKIIEFSSRNKFLILIITAFMLVGAYWCVHHIRLDAIPDLSDTQVIVYSRWDRSPDIVEDQVTYPIVTAMLGTPKVKAVRGFSDFGYSYVYVIFEDNTDIYWARSRVNEYLSKILPRLPEGVKTEMGPDATSVGWVYQYALVDHSGKQNLGDLRSLQDWYLRYSLQSVPGVSEVASVGGFEKQYQIQVNPQRLQSFNLSLMDVIAAVRKSNSESGARVIEFSGFEYMVRTRGYVHALKDLEAIVVGYDKLKMAPVLLRHVAKIQLGPEIRRGVTDLDGLGDTVGGIVIMRHGENALRVIERVKTRLNEMKPGLPEGVELIETYDRSGLIKESIDTLTHTLVEEMIVVSLVILVFLWHIPSAIIPIMTIPISVMLAFIPMYLLGLTSNIMSLAGIAISIGVLVDGAIVEVENAYKKLQLWNDGGRKGDYHEVRLNALKEVGPSVFFSLLVIAVAFMPIFTLIDQEGRLFKPLAMSKNLAMAIAAILAITLDPAIRMLFTRMDPYVFKPRFMAGLANRILVGRYYAEEKHPISRRLFHVYEPCVRWVLRHPKKTIAAAMLMVLTTIPVYFRLGSEFMPPLNEGSILYMPTAFPGMSVSEAQRVLQIQGRILKNFPEVERVFGKAGRAETSTDPAPLSMVETTVILKPKAEWRERPHVFPDWVPESVEKKLCKILPQKHLTYDELIQEMDEALQLPGIPNVWTMPIRNRIDMLSTGIRTPVGIKILGPDLKKIQSIGETIEKNLKDLSGIRTVYSERVAGGYFLDINLKREHLAHFGLTVEDVQSTLMAAVGGENVSTVIDGRARYPIQVRLMQDFRDDLPALNRLLIDMKDGKKVPLSLVADIQKTEGPAMIRNENGMVAGYVYIDIAGRDVGGFVKEAKERVLQTVTLPSGYHLVWSGQYENMERVKERLKVVIPLTLFLIAFLLYLNTRSAVKTGIVLLAVPFSLVGAVWLLYALGYNVSIAVWVGMIALMGLDAETGVFMLLYLDLSYNDAVRAGKMNTREDLNESIIHGAVKRVRPKIMTVMAAFIGLLPIMFSQGTGADMMKRVAAPMVGGLLSSFILELLVYPAIYLLWKQKSLKLASAA
ncbi:MAG: efflux RND transporter permease subunit [Candidatus Omnitrophica bacterium]|nr:efflux RND transporter permease subunit [Candidatus Omnitrophota bacterium]